MPSGMLNRDAEPDPGSGSDEVLSSAEIRELVTALGKGQPDGFSDEDAEKVVDWARQVRISQELIAMLLDHRLCAEIGPGGAVLISLPRGGKP